MIKETLAGKSQLTPTPPHKKKGKRRRKTEIKKEKGKKQLVCSFFIVMDNPAFKKSFSSGSNICFSKSFNPDEATHSGFLTSLLTCYHFYVLLLLGSIHVTSICHRHFTFFIFHFLLLRVYILLFPTNYHKIHFLYLSDMWLYFAVQGIQLS